MPGTQRLVTIDQSNGRPVRRLRFDDRGGGPGGSPLGPQHSGRRFVAWSVVGVVLAAGTLGAAFRFWKAGQVRRAEFGARRVAPAIEPLGAVVPPGVARADWARAVGAGRAMLTALTGAGVLDEAAMEALRAEVLRRVASARPATAARVLARLWDDQEDRAGPALTTAPRFELAATLHGLAARVPPGLAPDDWALAVVQARGRLVALPTARRLAPAERRALRDAWADRLRRAEAKDLPATLGRIWDEAADLAPIRADKSSLLADKP